MHMCSIASISQIYYSGTPLNRPPLHGTSESVLIIGGGAHFRGEFVLKRTFQSGLTGGATLQGS